MEWNGMKHGEKEWWKQQRRLNIACLTAPRYINTNHHQTQIHTQQCRRRRRRIQWVGRLCLLSFALSHRSTIPKEKLDGTKENPTQALESAPKTCPIRKIHTEWHTVGGVMERALTSHTKCSSSKFSNQPKQRFSIDNRMATEALSTVYTEAKPLWQNSSSSNSNSYRTTTNTMTMWNSQLSDSFFLLFNKTLNKTTA